MIEPTLTLTTLLSLALAVVFYVRMRWAERHVKHLEATRAHLDRLLDAEQSENDKLWEKLENTERLWKDAKKRYLDSLDEIAELRDGGNAAE